jgi:hypothetical protein
VKKKFDMRAFSLIAVLFVLTILTCFLIFRTRSLGAGISELKSEFESEAWSRAQEDLRLGNSINSMQSELEFLQSEFNNTIVQQKQELGDLTDEFEGLQSQMGWYFDWFNSTSSIPPSMYIEFSGIKACGLDRIRLPCIGLENWRHLYIKYLPDVSYSSGDFIQNVSTTATRQGGDCEDIATLFMAEANYLQGIFGLAFEGWKASDIATYNVIENWFMKNADAVLIPGRNVYVVCYSSGFGGHCINAFCEDEVIGQIREGRNPSEAIDSCTLVEPQNYGEVIYTSGNTIGNDYEKGNFERWLLLFSSEDMCMNTCWNNTGEWAFSCLPGEERWTCFTDVSERVAAGLERLNSYKP